MGRSTEALFSEHPDIEVWAAGGAVWRVVDDRPEILLVHRDSHGDWTLPKGKLDDGETLRACALREVKEETGFRCATGDRLSLVAYTDARDRAKAVVYWTMTVLGGAFAPNSEVDAVGWFDLASARSTLTYCHDVSLVDEIETAISSSTITP
ncbi:MAG: NUDIX hydrolase [Actinomycetota bacterium]